MVFHKTASRSFSRNSFYRLISYYILFVFIFCFSLFPALTVLAAPEGDTEDTSDMENTDTEQDSEDGATSEAEKDEANALLLNSKTAVLMDADTGAVLYELNGHEKGYPASITKMMTAILAVENCSMDEEVTFSNTAVSLESGASNIGITTGEIVSLHDCMYALLLASANECANGIAEHISGSIESFGELMTARAAELGALGTHFSNPSGLYQDSHYTTAYDMALIAREFLNHPELLEIETILNYTIGPTNLMNESRTFQQKHNMAYSGNKYFYPNGTFLAGKTGYTSASGTTLVTCVEKDGTRLIVVLFDANGKNAYADTITLLDYGFNSFSRTALADINGLNIDTESIISAIKSDFSLIVDEISYDLTPSVLLPTDYDTSLISTETVLLESVEENGHVGDMALSYNNVLQTTIPLYISMDTAKTVTEQNIVKDTPASVTAKSKKENRIVVIIVLLVFASVLGTVFGVLQVHAIHMRQKKAALRRQRYMTQMPDRKI